MTRETRILPAIRRLYDAATDAEKWPIFLEEVARAFDANGVHFFRFQPTEHALTFSILYGFDEAMLKMFGNAQGLRGALICFEQRYAQLMPFDPRARFVERYPSRPFSCRQVITEEELHSSKVYKDLLDPADVEYTLGVNLPEDDGSQIIIGIFRSKKSTFFKEREVELFGELIPHIKQAVALSEHLARVDFSNRAALEALDSVSFGILIVDEHARVMHANMTAKRIIDLRDGIAVRSGILSLNVKDENEVLHRAIWNAVSSVRLGQASQVQALAASRPSGNEPFPLFIGTLWGNHSRYGLGRLDRPVAVVFVTDPAERHEAPAELLRRIFGLTLSEARVCERLAQGATPAQIARDLDITTNTVRVHLRNVFAKTGVGRQAELVSKILSLPLWNQADYRGGGA